MTLIPTVLWAQRKDKVGMGMCFHPNTPSRDPAWTPAHLDLHAKAAPALPAAPFAQPSHDSELFACDCAASCGVRSSTSQ